MSRLLANSWQLQLDRGPNCLFVRLCPHPGRASHWRRSDRAGRGDIGCDDTGCDDTTCDDAELAERLNGLLEEHLTNRLVLEMDDVDLLTSLLLGQLVDLSNRVRTQGGMVRLCGLSSDNQYVLRTTRLDRRLPHYTDRFDAVHGGLPARPR